MSSEVIPPNYVAYRKDRTDGYGGVMIVIKSDLISEEITNIRSKAQTEALFVKILLLEKQTLIVGGIYRPPNNAIAYATELTNYYLLYRRNSQRLSNGFVGILTFQT